MCFHVKKYYNTIHMDYTNNTGTEDIKQTLTILFLYNAEVRCVLQLRHLSNRTKSGSVTRKSRISNRKKSNLFMFLPIGR